LGILWAVGVVTGEVGDDLLTDEVVHEEAIIVQQFFQQVELAGLVVGDDIVEDELKPLGDVHLEKGVFADEFVDDFVEGVVEL
jgi:hypothetical protein